MITKCFSSVLELPTSKLVCPQRLALEELSLTAFLRALDLVTRVICPVSSALTLKSSADFTSEPRAVAEEQTIRHYLLLHN